MSGRGRWTRACRRARNTKHQEAIDESAEAWECRNSGDHKCGRDKPLHASPHRQHGPPPHPRAPNLYRTEVGIDSRPNDLRVPFSASSNKTRSTGGQALVPALEDRCWGSFTNNSEQSKLQGFPAPTTTMPESLSPKNGVSPERRALVSLLAWFPRLQTRSCGRRILTMSLPRTLATPWYRARPWISG